MWKQDDIGHFANNGALSAQIVRDGRRWRWIIFNGGKVASARTRTLDEAKDCAAYMIGAGR